MESQDSSSSRTEIEPGNFWTADEDALLIQLKVQSPDSPWNEIAKRFSRRNSSQCSQHYQKLKRDALDNEKKNELARLYESHKEEMWMKVAERMSEKVSWTDAERNHWRIGKSDMARRAGDEFLSVAVAYIPQLGANSDAVQESRLQQFQQQRWSGAAWSGQEEAVLFSMIRENMTWEQWEDISSCLPGRTPKACEHHRYFLFKRCDGWSPELQNELCKVYKGLKSELWAKISEQLLVSRERAENMHWELGEEGIAERAGLSLSPQSQTAADLTLAPREPGQTTKEWLNFVCQ
ncbi:hypothetical protein E4U40_001036 [Claviceps sp. LM458 group G5]|nr:hypothetical protein E4U40_001036 [Claviceps sp. LM458 group G5]